MCDIECVFESMTAKGSIFISNYAAAQDLHLLQAKGIQGILSVARSGLLRHSKEDVPYYLYLPAEDHEEYEIYKFFNETFDFIEQARKHTNVLVHCMAGISRSVTIVIAYLLKKFKCSLGEIITMLQRKRSKINPNKGFIEQLKKYAEQEGLKCNFDYEEVPSPKERSPLKRKISYSKSKEKIKKQMYNFPAAVSRKPSQKQYESVNFQKTAASKADLSQSLHKAYEPHKQNQASEMKIACKREDRLSQNENQECQTLPSPTLKHNRSIDSKTPKNSKKLSIQQKIGRVRERILQKEQVRNSSSKRGVFSSKENKLAMETKKKNSSRNNLNDYLYMYSRQNPLPIKFQRQNEEQRQLGNTSKHFQQLAIHFCSTQQNTASQQYRIQPRSLYSKMQKKRSSVNPS